MSLLYLFIYLHCLVIIHPCSIYLSIYAVQLLYIPVLFISLFILCSDYTSLLYLSTYLLSLLSGWFLFMCSLKFAIGSNKTNKTNKILSRLQKDCSYDLFHFTDSHLSFDKLYLNLLLTCSQDKEIIQMFRPFRKFFFLFDFISFSKSCFSELYLKLKYFLIFRCFLRIRFIGIP